MTGPGKPSRIPVDLLRAKTYAALKAAGHRGVFPAIDNVRQSVAAMSAAGISVKDQAAALDASQNYIRVCKRNNALRLLGEPSPLETPKEKRKTVAERKWLASIPNHSLEELHSLALTLSAQLDNHLVAAGDVERARALGRDDLIRRIKARSDVAAP